MSDEEQTQIGDGEVAALITGDALEALRGGYDDDVMADAATAAMVRDLPESAGYVRAVHDSLFGGSEGNEERSLAGLTDKEREVGLIVLMASQRATMELAIHMYWGMMEGITPHEVSGLMLLTGVYAGIGRQTTGMKVMRSVLTALQQRYEESLGMSSADERKQHLATVPVLYALVDAFA